MPARLLTMIRGAGPGRYLVITDGAGAVPVVGLEEIGCSSPARMRRRDQLAAAGGFTALLSPVRETGVSVALGSVARRRPRLETARGRAAGDRGAGGHEGAVGRVVDARGGEGDGERERDGQRE